MNKSYIRITSNNKDIIFNIFLDTYSSFKLTFTYSSISNTYSGFLIECYTTTVRGILRKYPNFFEEDFISTKDLEKWLKENGFTQRKPTEIETLMYK